jgi:glycolate oxidase FAD binding subunit
MSTTAMRQGSASDAVDGVVPRQVVEPETAADLADALSSASRDRLVTVLRGGGTKLGWGRTPLAVDRVVSTARLNTQIVHRHGDLTVTAHAGVTLKQLNQELARYGQWLPIDSAFEGATIGGIVATNDAGPLRHRFGTPRDLLIGVSLAMPDGRLVKAGGHVVKNVAGYDLGKFISGSFGSFAAIVDATFKLLPMPQASATLVATYQDVERMTRDVAAIGGSQLEPVAFDVRVPPAERTSRPPVGGSGVAKTYQLLLRLASSPSAVDAQVLSVQRMLTGHVSMRRDAEESALWSDHIRAPWLQQGAVVRVAWLPAKLEDVMTLVDEVQRMADGRVSLSGRVGTGAGLLTIEGDVLTQAAVINRLRSSVFVGNVTVLGASRELKSQVDVWSLAAGPMKTLRALKESFDSAGIMNAGRGPV